MPPRTPLPVLYMADGFIGVEIAVLDLKAALDAGTVSPMMVVGTNPKPKPEERAGEYVQEWSIGRSFELHEAWLTQKVVPWAEHTMGASPERAHRFVGGFSNGGALALWLAYKHPDIFAGALVHSPVGGNSSWIGEGAATQRWVLSGGTMEMRGYTLLNHAATPKPVVLSRDLARVLQAKNAPVRLCIGNWEHEGRAWRKISAGSIVWLMGLGNPESVETQHERDVCHSTP